MSFVHLHTHSEYSLLESTCRTKQIAKQAAALGMPAAAITDNGNMFGAVEFYFACKDVNVKPILGMDVYIAPKSRLIKGEDRDVVSMPNRRLVLLAKNYEGYQELCRLSTIGYQEGFYYKPRVDYEVLKKHSNNLIALTGGLRGEVAFQFLEHGPDRAIEKIEELQEIYGSNLYLEMQRTGVSEWQQINEFYQEISRKLNVPLVATNDVHYMTRDDSFAQEVLVCVATNKSLQDESRFKLGSNEFYFKSVEQMKNLFSDVPEAIENTLKIADQIDVKFKLKDDKGKTIYHLPEYPTQNGASSTEEIRRLAFEGLEVRLIEAKERGEPVAEEKRTEYHARLEKELGIIDKMGFNGYFLIVQDFINWAKQHDIPVGPGRGSGAGSLVAYALRITDLDPMPYALIFERFLNPERISMPDFDIDFCQDRRGEVIRYVTEKYDPSRVSQIITFGKLKARMALRDVGRVLGMSFQEVDVVAKLIPEELDITLSKAIEKEPKLNELAEEDPKIATLLDLAQRVEGLNRHAGIHAAGVVISDQPIVELAPLYRGEGDENVVQFDMKNSEKMGLIKFDFLGLKTLTLIYDALRLIEKNRGKKITEKEILLSDKGIYSTMSKGDTAGIFQFEGSGISEFIKKVKPTCFEDITAINALYRPGPMQFLDEYAGRKSGKLEVRYLFPELEDILKETYGIIVYQEHVQLIAAKIASYSLGEADILRRAMGKKQPEEMAKQKTRFLEGAKKNGFDLERAGELFDQMAKFAEYGFNKSHAAAYCVVAAQTAWLKCYYPVEFFAAMLSTEMSDTDKVVQYVKDVRAHGLEVRAPHVNYSDRKFSVSGEVIFFGLGAIKGVGDAAIEAIREARQNLGGKFSSLEEFFTNVDLRRVNKKVIECLIKAGALDDFGATRAQLIEVYPKYVDQAENERKDRELGQVSLFEMSDEKEEIPLPKVTPWSKMQSLNYEKEVLGFFLSDHPLSGLMGFLKPFANTTVAGLSQYANNMKLSVAGVIPTYREMITKKGTRMAFGQLEDLEGTVELVIFPDSYAKVKDNLRPDYPVIIEGVVKKEGESVKLMVDNITAWDIKVVQSRNLKVVLDESMTEHLEELHNIFTASPGNTSVRFEVPVAGSSRVALLTMNEPKGVQITGQMLEKLHSVFGRTDFLSVQ